MGNQSSSKAKPLYVVTNKSPLLIRENEALFLKNYRISFNVNKDGEESYNYGVGTPIRASKEFKIMLPPGKNMNVGFGECLETNEAYILNWNSNNDHGIYVIYGNTLTYDPIYIGPELNFTLDPAHQIPEHRMHLRVHYQNNDKKSGIIREKHFIYTEGNNWQRWVNVIAAIKTKGFNADQFPYFKLRGPHFDKNELIDLAVRPPMFCPKVTAIESTEADIGKTNNSLNKSIQFAYQGIYTDGRATSFSPWSTPFILLENACNSSNNGLPRCMEIRLNALSPMIERLILYRKNCNGDWYKYDTIERFPDKDSFGNYWERTGQWTDTKKDPDYIYDAVNNEVVYRYCGNKECAITSQDEANTVFNEVPIRSIALTGAGDAIILANNERFYNNLPQSELSKFKLSVLQKENSFSNTKLVKIKLYAYMGRDGYQTQFLWKDGEDGKTEFGGSDYTAFNTNSFNQNKEEARYFELNTGDQKGLMCYLANTGYYAIGKQYKVDAGGNLSEQEVFDITDQNKLDFVKETYDSGGYFVQVFEFTVAPGKYIARLARHGANPDEQYEKTSTFVIGIANRKKVTGKGLVQWDAVETPYKEIEIDACNGDVDVWDQDKSLFYIYVPYAFEQSQLFSISNNRYRFIEGYVYEDDENKVGIEQLKPEPTHGFGDLKKSSLFTDHNGHYFQFTAKASAYKSEVYFLGRMNCENQNRLFETKIRLSSRTDRGYYKENVSVKDYNSKPYGACNRIIVKGTVTDCKGNFGLSGVGITMTGSRGVRSGADGTFELVVHNGFNPDRNERLYINSGGGSCQIIPCDNTCGVVYDYHESNVACTVCNERIYPTQFNPKFNTESQSILGQKEGGRYGVVVNAFDLAGRPKYAGLIDYLDIPTFMDIGKFDIFQIKWDLLAALALPLEVAWITFGVTKNLVPAKYIQWVGDKIRFFDADNNEVENGAGAVKAKITVQSLLDYNTENNFSTTVTYQFTKGDILRVYDDGDGKLLDPKLNSGYLDYPIQGTDFTEPAVVDEDPDDNVVPEGKVIVIPYDKRLLQLKDKCGFWLEIRTPKSCDDKEEYFEACGTYPVKNGNIDVKTGVIQAFDTFYQRRSIGITNCTGKAILHPFLSTSITDFWGENCYSGGRISIRDPQAEQRWYPDDFIKSDEFINEGRVNGLGRFRESNRKTYKGQDKGGVVALRAENKVLAVICQNDWFVTDYDNNFARVSPDGRILANLDTNIGDPQAKVSKRFGCDYANIGTVVVDDDNGFIFWADTKNEAVIAMDYRTAQDITLIDNKGYFSDKINAMKKHNNSLSEERKFLDMIELNIGWNPKYKEVCVTFRPRKGLSEEPQYFTNTEREINYSLPETITFSLEMADERAIGKWARFEMFAPEFYGKLRHSRSGNEFISMVNGTVNFHNSKDVRTFNRFYGVDDTMVITLAFNMENSDDKTWQNVVIDTPEIKYFIDQILTNNQNTFSYIPMSSFVRKKNIMYASVLRNMITYPSNAHPIVSPLVDGGKIAGQYCIIRLVRDLSKMNDYSETDKIWLGFFSGEKEQK